MPLALALDLGTTSTAAVAVDATGRIVHVVRRSHAAEIDGLPAGHAEQDPNRHLSTGVSLLQELSAHLDDEPVSLGLTGQMHSVQMLDDDQQPLGNLITWQDRRANERVTVGRATFLEEYLSRCDQEAIRDTGCRPSPGYAAVSLFALSEEGQLPGNLDRVSLLADWVAAQLTGAAVVTERSNAASTGVYDLTNDRWSDGLIDAGGLDKDWFPPVVDNGTVVGPLTDQMAAETALPAGLPVMVPIGDNQASVIGSVPLGEPAIQITIGTGGQINWPVDEFVRVSGMDTRPLPPGRLMVVGAGLAGGDAFAWVNRTVCQWLGAFGVDRAEDEIYALLTRTAANVAPGSEGLTCEPFFRGTRPEPLRRARFAGVGPENFTPGHVARAVLEGIVSSMHGLWERTTTDDRPVVSRIIGCGNGLEQNPLLVEIIKQRFGLPVLIPGHQESAAYGAALLAGVAEGMWPDLASAGEGIELHAAGERR